MLDKKQFLKGLKYLNDYYVNFKFDINDNNKLGIWYSVFEEVDDETFVGLIKEYCKENIYAPQSPTHLLEYAKTRIIANFMSPDEAWEYAIGLLRRVGYTFSRFYEKVEHVVISQSIKAIESEFYNLYTESLPFVKRNFVKVYEEKLKEHVSGAVRKNQFSLAGNTNLALNYSGGQDE